MIRMAEHTQGQISGVSQCQKCQWNIYLQWTFLRRGSIDPIEIYNPKDVGVDKMLKLIILEGFKILWQEEFSSLSSHPLLQPSQGTKRYRKMMTVRQEKDNLQEHGNARLLTDIWLRASHVNPSIWFSILKRSGFLDWKQIKVSLTYSRKPFIFNII